MNESSEKLKRVLDQLVTIGEDQKKEQEKVFCKFWGAIRWEEKGSSSRFFCISAGKFRSEKWYRLGAGRTLKTPDVESS